MSIEILSLTSELERKVREEISTLRLLFYIFSCISIGGILMIILIPQLTSTDIPLFWVIPFIMLLVGAGVLWFYRNKMSKAVATGQMKKVSGLVQEKQVKLADPVDKLDYSYTIDEEKQTALIWNEDNSDSEKIIMTDKLKKGVGRVHSNVLYQFSVDEQWFDVTPSVYFNYIISEDFTAYYLMNEDFISDEKGLKVG